MKPYYEYKGITIYHGDCRDILPKLEPVDLVLTDPPYGIGKAEWDKRYPRWAVIEAFKISQTVCIMPGLWALPECIDDFGNRYKWIIAGHNLNGMTHGAIGFGNWIPAVCGGGIPHGGQDAFDFSIGSEPKYNHPDQKPLPFMKQLVSRLSKEGQTILDPFMGSGTTKPGDRILDTHGGSFSLAIACNIMGFEFVGCEIDQEYFYAAIERIKNTPLKNISKANISEFL